MKRVMGSLMWAALVAVSVFAQQRSTTPDNRLGEGWWKGRYEEKIMPDLLHPNAKGYEIWAKSVMPAIKETLGK